MFNSALELLNICKEKNLSIPEVIIEKEFELYGKSAAEIYKSTENILEVMENSALSSLDSPNINRGHIIGGDAYLMNEYSKSNGSYCGSEINKAMAMAFSTSEVNAAMGKICAAPTAGSSGILPAALISAKNRFAYSTLELSNALLTASAIGELVTKNATVSGAEGGCQAECGSAAAMASAALVYLHGGSNEAIFHSASIAFKNIMGLICDPIAGLVESPCAKRNASGVINAMISADMALAGVKSVIPFDEVVEAMYKVGRALPPSLRETAQGGIAITKTGKEFTSKIYKK